MDNLIVGKRYNINHVYDGKFVGVFVETHISKYINEVFKIDGKRVEFEDHHITWERIK